jgi:hypothetical protein
MSEGTTTRRRAPRIPVRLEAAYEDPARQIFLATRDLSELGVYLMADEAPEEGVAARVTLELPGEPAMLRLDGVVARRDPGLGFALAFETGSMAPSTRSALRAFTRESETPRSQ